MKRRTRLVLMMLLGIGILSCSTEKGNNPLSMYAEVDKTAPLNTLTENEANNGWQLLSDGLTFDGLHGYNMTGIPDCWTIQDGVFTMTTTGGGESQDIITDKVYKNFALFLEFKLDKGANSGIIFQLKEDTAYQFPYETGPEFQVIDHDNWPDPLEDWQICGGNYGMYPPKVKPYKALGEWNQAFLLVDGNNVTQILNDEITVCYEKYSEEWNQLRNSGKWSDFPDWGKFDEGHISLQNHGTNVWYRNVKIKELK